MKLWVGSENVSPYLTRVHDTTVADFQVLVWGDLQVEGNSQIIVIQKPLSANLINSIELDNFIEII